MIESELLDTVGCITSENYPDDLVVGKNEKSQKNMEFKDAIELLLNGEKIRRKKWPKDEYIERCHNIIMDEKNQEYTIDCLDYEKSDWEVYEGKTGCVTDKSYSESLKHRESEKINKNKIPFDWYVISQTECSKTARAKVIGGWVLYNTQFQGIVPTCQSMVFIPDPAHLWEI